MASKAVAEKTSKRIAFVAKRIAKPKDAAPTPKADTETSIKLEKEALAERLKRVCVKPLRSGVIVATADQDAAIESASTLDDRIAELGREIKRLDEEKRRLLEPLCRALDDRQRYEITGSRRVVRAEAYEASLSLKMPGVSYRLRDK